MRIIVFDIEANGMNPSQVCQLAWLTIGGGRVAGRNMYFAVDEMNEYARQVHGMSREDVEALSGGQRFADQAAFIRAAFDACDCFVGHNVASDRKYLRAELERCGLALPDKPALCTMNYFTRVMKLERRFDTRWPKPPRLEELAAYYGLTDESVAARARAWFGGGGAAHDARFDAAATWLSVLAAMEQGDLPPVELWNEKGIISRAKGKMKPEVRKT